MVLGTSDGSWGRIKVSGLQLCTVVLLVCTVATLTALQVSRLSGPSAYIRHGNGAGGRPTQHDLLPDEAAQQQQSHLQDAQSSAHAADQGASQQQLLSQEQQQRQQEQEQLEKQRQANAQQAEALKQELEQLRRHKADLTAAIDKAKAELSGLVASEMRQAREQLISARQDMAATMLSQLTAVKKDLDAQVKVDVAAQVAQALGKQQQQQGRQQQQPRAQLEPQATAIPGALATSNTSSTDSRDASSSSSRFDGEDIEPSPALGVLTPATCSVEEHADYDGDKIQDGASHKQASLEACCAACGVEPRCNVFVYCPLEGGCGGSSGQGSCWLKHQEDFDPTNVRGPRGNDVPFMSGASMSDADRVTWIAKESARLAALKLDEELPLVWLDIAVNGSKWGRVEVVLFKREAPLAAENFRAMCTGELGVIPEGQPGAGKAYSFKGAKFYRIIEGFINQAGVWMESVYGGTYPDDEGGKKLKHDRKGLLSLANAAPNQNDNHFSIMVGPAHHLDGKMTVFGEVVGGYEILQRVNRLAHGHKDSTIGAVAGVTISDCGQIREGGPVADTVREQYSRGGRTARQLLQLAEGRSMQAEHSMGALQAVQAAHPMQNAQLLRWGTYMQSMQTLQVVQKVQLRQLQQAVQTGSDHTQQQLASVHGVADDTLVQIRGWLAKAAAAAVANPVATSTSTRVPVVQLQLPTSLADILKRQPLLRQEPQVVMQLQAQLRQQAAQHERQQQEMQRRQKERDERQKAVAHEIARQMDEQLHLQIIDATNETAIARQQQQLRRRRQERQQQQAMEMVEDELVSVLQALRQDHEMVHRRRQLRATSLLQQQQQQTEQQPQQQVQHQEGQQQKDEGHRLQHLHQQQQQRRQQQWQQQWQQL